MLMNYDDSLRDTLFYSFAKKVIFCIGIILFRPRFKGLENVPETGGVVLAGNHTSNLDWLLHMMAIKRHVHFLGKIELYKGKFSWLMKKMGVIPVDRSIHDKQAMRTAVKGLIQGKCIAVFPEGTINRTDDTIMPFKFGAVRMASLTGTPVVPFTIKGRFSLFGKGPILTFYSAIFPCGSDLTDYNDELMGIVKVNLETEL